MTSTRIANGDPAGDRTEATRYVIHDSTGERPGRTYDIIGVLVGATRTYQVIRDREGVTHSVPSRLVVCAHPHGMMRSA